MCSKVSKAKDRRALCPTLANIASLNSPKPTLANLKNPYANINPPAPKISIRASVASFSPAKTSTAALNKNGVATAITFESANANRANKTRRLTQT